MAKTQATAIRQSLPILIQAKRVLEKLCKELCNAKNFNLAIALFAITTGLIFISLYLFCNKFFDNLNGIASILVFSGACITTLFSVHIREFLVQRRKLSQINLLQEDIQKQNEYTSIESEFLEKQFWAIYTELLK